mmetsp:Transcript_8052/g.17478  ORF Transcript_8052/g.17478 Transcript_8052/m.17478 type:complete len:522 (+) Transcript_8052:47-1612(+)
MAAQAPTKVVSQAELLAHNEPGNAWVAVDGLVYDVSKFARLHPGGAAVLEQLAGHDVSEEFYALHRKDVLVKYARLRVGRLEGAEGPAIEKGTSLSAPFAEISAFAGRESPYYTDSHRRLRQSVQDFMDAELAPIALERDLKGEYPDRELQAKLGSSGLLVSRMGPGPWLNDAVKLGISIPGDVKPEEFDYFHELLAHQEIGRIGLPGFIDALGAGWLISAPAIFNFGSAQMKQDVGQPLLRGVKWSALAISEPFAGSDVAALRATAEKTPDGKFYIVNGVKKWITEGTYADYFVTAVRTGGPGAAGLSLILIERGDGVDTSQIKTTYSTCAGTALVIFNNVKVPAENLLGKENDGFRLIMYNFNHERWLICNNLLGQIRAALGDAFLWAKQRKVFGKALIEQPVIRLKLASAASAAESVQCHMEAITYDMCKSHDGPLGSRLAGPIALLKYQTTRTAWQVADETVQILGGRGITRTGMGAKIEGLKNYAKYAAVYGGSEEIMADLAVKQALRGFSPKARL